MLSDALTRYLQIMDRQVAAEADVTRLADERAACLAEMSGAGWSLAQIAEATGLSRARVQQLVTRARLV